MRAWLYDTLTTDPDLEGLLGGNDPESGILKRVVPRESQSTINLPKPFLVYGLGNATNENLGEDTDHEAWRQFSQIWVHDEGGDYNLIDDIVELIRQAFHGKGSPAHQIITTRWLETSQEFSNETYGTLFRYLRFQHIIAKGATQ